MEWEILIWYRFRLIKVCFGWDKLNNSDLKVLPGILNIRVSNLDIAFAPIIGLGSFELREVSIAADFPLDFPRYLMYRWNRNLKLYSIIDRSQS